MGNCWHDPRALIFTLEHGRVACSVCQAILVRLPDRSACREAYQVEKGGWVTLAQLKAGIIRGGVARLRAVAAAGKHNDNAKQRSTAHVDFLE